MGKLYIDGVDLWDAFHVMVSGEGTCNTAEADTTSVSVVGRSGDLIIDRGRYKNVSLKYAGFQYADNRATFEENNSDFRNYLSSNANKYVKIADSYHPDEYRMGRLNGGVTIDVNGTHDAGKFNLMFNCKPQRFLTSGDTVQTFTANGTITNPQIMASKPMIRVYGVGECTIGTYTVRIADDSPYSYIDIDCDAQTCFYGLENANQYVVIDEFPILESGVNNIVIGDMTKIEIVPKWWKL